MSRGIREYRLYSSALGKEILVEAYNNLNANEREAILDAVEKVFVYKQMFKVLGVKRIIVVDSENPDVIYTVFP